MSKKMIYLTSFVLVLSLAGKGWSYASIPHPADGALYENTWASLSWLPGPHAVTFDIYLGENYDDVKHGTGGTFKGNQSSQFFIVGFFGYPYSNGLVPGTTYYWRIDEINHLHPDSPWTGDVWSFKVPSSTAYAPEPADDARFIDRNVTLSWEPGFGAILHIVYFGDSFAEVNNASGGRPQGTTTYTPGLLESGKTYYWRVDEFDGSDTHKGDVWSFTAGAGVPPDVVPPDAVGGNIYVDAVHGNDNNEGLTPGTAFATIQKGIDAAVDSDVVRVYPGLYEGEINFLGKALVVQGVTAGAAGIPVLHNPGDFVVSFYSGEGPDSILRNFVIRNSFMAVFIAGSSPTISNLTILDNMYGIEAYNIRGFEPFGDSEPDISNSIFWNNIGGDLFGCQARYSCISGAGANIDDDPLLVDPDRGDYHLRSRRGRYWPEHNIWVLDTVTSPCIDGGDPSADPLNEPAPNGGRINIGAYGGTVQASLTPEWLPGQAFNPNPANGTIEVDRNTKLSWNPGSDAVLHDVYFGTVDPPPLVSSQTMMQFDPGTMNRETVYYWRVDEIDSKGNNTVGAVWRFTTATSAPPPPPKGRTCFVAETGVWVDGTLVSISSVGLRRSVGRIDGAAIKNSSLPLPYLGKVQELQEHQGIFECYDVLLQSGNRIGVAERHYFLTESGKWIAVQDLKTGSKLQTPKGSIGIVSVTKRPMPYVGKVYNLKVEGSDRYLVGKDAIIVRDY